VVKNVRNIDKKVQVVAEDKPFGPAQAFGLSLKLGLLVFFAAGARYSSDGIARAVTAGASFGAAIALLSLVVCLAVVAVHRRFPRSVVRVPPDSEGPDALAARYLGAVLDEPVLAAAWMRTITGFRLDERSQRVAPPPPFDRSPAILAVTETEVVLGMIRWPGPSIAILGRWLRGTVVATREPGDRLAMTIEGVGQVELRPDNDGSNSQACLDILSAKEAP
jgi:hypothetical protein